MSEWISVKAKKKPRVLQSVLCCLENDFVIMAGYMGNNIFTITLGVIKEIPENNPVTHWMPLPEPPKK